MPFTVLKKSTPKRTTCQGFYPHILYLNSIYVLPSISSRDQAVFALYPRSHNQKNSTQNAYLHSSFGSQIAVIGYYTNNEHGCHLDLTHWQVLQGSLLQDLMMYQR